MIVSPIRQRSSEHGGRFSHERSRSSSVSSSHQAIKSEPASPAKLSLSLARQGVLVAALKNLNVVGAPFSPEASCSTDPFLTARSPSRHNSAKQAIRQTPTRRSRTGARLHSTALKTERDVRLSPSKLKSAKALVRGSDRIKLRVPQSLPAPRLQASSSPHEDLVGHLLRHNFYEEAREAHESHMPASYLLDAYLRTGQSLDLFQQAKDFVGHHQLNISRHLRPGTAAPESVLLDISASSSHPPSHLLAVYSTNKVATIYAVHGLVMSLQCVSIPFFPRSESKIVEGKHLREVPVVNLQVPHPDVFGPMMRWLYNRSTTALFNDLLPTQHLVRFLSMKITQQRAQSSSQVATSNSPSHLVEALSVLTTRQLLEILQKIQAFWKNGVALGIIAQEFWTQLDRSWSLVISAMMLAKE